MRSRALFLALFSTLAIGEGMALGGPLSGNCRLGDQPAATLLFPYFELDLKDPRGSTTLLSINNAFASTTLARVVLWTDWGVPTLAFDVYLTGFDVQTLNLRDLFVGRIPETSPETSPRGSFSLPDPELLGCDVERFGDLSPLETEWLRAAHTGSPLPASGSARCASSASRESGLATGYVTVDVVNRCSPSTLGETQGTPVDPSYFSTGGRGLAGNQNVLWGDVIEIDRISGATSSEAAVHIVADADFFGPGDYTFYGRYVGFDSRDDRAPLASLYHARYLAGGDLQGETELLVWRDTREKEPSSKSCTTPPRWLPLGEAQIAIFDEEENPQRVSEGRAFPLATQKIAVGGPELPMDAPFGWIMLDLWHANLTHAQAWVQVRLSSGGTAFVGHRALAADDLCVFGP